MTGNHRAVVQREVHTPIATLHASVQLAALLVGVLFVIVGICGFIPVITTHYDALTWLGQNSGAKLFGLFTVSVLHNIVHWVFGLAGIGLARTFSGARWYLIGGGVIYVALWIYGLAIDRRSAINFIPVNTADNWLHLGFGLAMLGLGLWLFGPRHVMPATPVPTSQERNV